MKLDVNANDSTKDSVKDSADDWGKQEVRRKISHFYNATITHSHSTQFNRNAWKTWEKASKKFENTVTSHVGWSCIVSWWAKQEVGTGTWKKSLSFLHCNNHTLTSNSIGMHGTNGGVEIFLRYHVEWCWANQHCDMCWATGEATAIWHSEEHLGGKNSRGVNQLQHDR